MHSTEPTPIDPYFLLGLDRRLFLDSNIIEEAFRRAAAEHHPDQTKGSTTSFQELQEAVGILRDPAKRLRYLAAVAEPRSLPLPLVAAEFFPIITSTLQQTDLLIKKHQAASGTLVKALMMKELLEQRSSIQNALLQIETWHESLQQKLRELDTSDTNTSPEALLELANQFTFAQRWKQQLCERAFTLSTLTN